MSDLTGAEFSGKSVEEATAEGLRTLGLRAEEATIEVINRGSRGLFGIGSEPAVVRIQPKSATPTASESASAYHTSDAATGSVAAEAFDAGDEVDEVQPANVAASSMAATDVAEAVAVDDVILAATVIEEVPLAQSGELQADAGAADDDTDSDSMDAEVADMGIEMLSEMVRLMGFECTVEAAWKDADDITDERHLLLSVHGPEASGLIGRRGETLENIQYLLRLMVNQRMHRWMNIIVDIEEYRARRVEHLTHLAERMAQQAVDSGRSQALEPMTPNERRIVHLVLRDDTRVFTESTGEGERRKVVIFPKR